jgi:hypothetical protein
MVPLLNWKRFSVALVSAGLCLNAALGQIGGAILTAAAAASSGAVDFKCPAPGTVV